MSFPRYCKKFYSFLTFKVLLILHLLISNSFYFKTKLWVLFSCPSIFSPPGYCISVHGKLFPFWHFQVELVISFSVLDAPEDCSLLLQLKIKRKRKSLAGKWSSHDHPIYQSLILQSILLYPCLRLACSMFLFRMVFKRNYK